MPTQWNSAAAAMTTSASRSVIPWSTTIAGTTPRRNSRRASRRAMFVTIWTWTHEWSVSPSRAALTPATCHHALTCGSAFTASMSWSSLRLPRVGARMRIAAIASAGAGRVGGLASASYDIGRQRTSAGAARPSGGARVERVEEPGQRRSPLDRALEVHVVAGVRDLDEPHIGPRGDHGPRHVGRHDAAGGADHERRTADAAPCRPCRLLSRLLEHACHHGDVEAQPQAVGALL